MPDTEILFSGRQLSAQDIELIRQVAADFPKLTLHELANTVSELLDWHRPTGKVKTRECVDLLQHLAAKGLLTALPVVQRTSPRGSRRVLISSCSDPTGADRWRSARSLAASVPADRQPGRSHSLSTVHPALPLPRLPHPLRRATALLCPIFFRSIASDVGLFAVHQCRMEDGSAGSLDRLGRFGSPSESGSSGQSQPVFDSALGFRLTISPATCCLALSLNCPTIGGPTIRSNPCCWKPWSI